MAETINCTAESLLDASACFSCIPKGQQQQVLIWLLANIAGGSTDPATLVSQSKCMSCVPREMREAVITYLLCQIASTGVTVCEQVLQYVTDPTTEGLAPGNINAPAVAYQQDGVDPIFTWNTTTHVWQ